MKEIIDYTLVDLRGEHYVETLQSQLEIRPNSLLWTVKCYSDILNDPDDMKMGWKETQYKEFHCLVLKRLISNAGITWSTYNKLWLVYVQASGMSSDIDIWFKSERDAQILFQKLDKYLNT